MIFGKAGRWLRKRPEGKERQTDGETEVIAGYYAKAMNLFGALQIDVESKPAEKRRLYHMMLLYLDREEAICPAASRTASLSGFLDSLGGGAPLEPGSEDSKSSAEDVDRRIAIEISRNHLGLKAIHDEIAAALAAFNAKHSS
jgi:hypothetical protein